jgi:7,8-dihydropterin-6-yl-methyl-4-(beta-D-ribofuranosyl)aminobenzene 5'-phosphate synthase
MGLTINEVEKVDILTLQDNYIDLVSQDNTEIIQRAMPLIGTEIKNSVLAEHGFASLVTITNQGGMRSMLFDFGFSENGAAFNAEALSADLTTIEVLALSHGHLDHVGGIEKLVKKIGKDNIELVLHPAAFRSLRYVKVTEDFKVHFPPFTREKAQAAGVALIESEEPYPLLDNTVIFLGEIPRHTDFEKGSSNLCYEENGEEKQDPINDDSAIVFNVKDKGLVILSGCAHAGIINTARYAQVVTGIDTIYAIMGGFHLTGADFDSVVKPTSEALENLDPDYVVPTHCTGREAIMHIEKEMPDKFLLNMAGTKLTFS